MAESEEQEERRKFPAEWDELLPPPEPPVEDSAQKPSKSFVPNKRAAFRKVVDEDSPTEELDWDSVIPKSAPDSKRGNQGRSSGTKLNAPPSLGSGPRWHQPEMAWPIALLAGFAGSTIGIQSGFPGVGSILAVVFFLPIYLSLISHQRTRMAALISIGWMAGVAGAAAGSVIDGDFSDVARACAGAYRFRDAEIRPWLEGARTGPTEWIVLPGMVIGFVLLLLSRPSAGIGSLLGLALLCSAVGAGVGWFASQTASMEPSTAALLGIPPHRAFAFIGLALVSTALADRRRLRPLGEIRDERRGLLLSGLALMLLALLLEPVLVSAWGSWMSEAVG